jgi:hypothetical protein
VSTLDVSLPVTRVRSGPPPKEAEGERKRAEAEAQRKAKERKPRARVFVGIFIAGAAIVTGFLAAQRDPALTQTIAVVVYIVFCILVGLYGNQRRTGFTGTFILSFFITPFVVLIVLLLTGLSQRIARQRRPQDT